MTGGLTRAQLNAEIAELEVRLIVREDWHGQPGWVEESKALRDRIHNLQHQRDQLPPDAS